MKFIFYTNLYVVRHCHVCRYVIVDNISFCLNYRNSNTYRVIRYGIYTFLKSKVERKVGPLLLKREKDISSRISVLDSSNVCCRISNNTIYIVMQVYCIFLISLFFICFTDYIKYITCVRYLNTLSHS